MENKRRSYTRPWFWLLIILILSVVFKLLLREDAIPAIETVGETVFNSENSVREIAQTERAKTESAETEKAVFEQDSNQENSAKKTFHFILNKSTKKYHTTECSGAKKLSESKRTDTDIEAQTEEEAREILEKEGYELCGICAKQVQ